MPALLIEKYFSWQLREYSLKFCRATCVCPSLSLSLACLPKVILHVVHYFICLISLPLFSLCPTVATFYWNEIPVFFLLTFSFFHIFCVKCNNLYSWCVLRTVSLSHGWRSTTVYWLGLPLPPPPLIPPFPFLLSWRDLDFELVSLRIAALEIGVNVWELLGQVNSNDINGNWACPER